MVPLVFPAPDAWAVDEKAAARIVKTQCAGCHKFAGQPESKFKLKAPDLMWAGNKYQRPWLIRWLRGDEENLYPNGYRWDQSGGAFRHMTLSGTEAAGVADYLEKHYVDPRVKKQAIDLSQFSERESQFGAEIFKQFSCLGCHQIREDGKKTGGPISVTLYDAGNRYNVDWLYRFALNPQDFTPHSGEYLADLTGRGVRHLIGYLMTLGVKNYKFYEPWESGDFKNAQAQRGQEVYKVYCSQCHGAKGEGDGPGAPGLEPKPAVHAKMNLHDLPQDYLYNVIFYGGKSVGKSPMMPDWGLTLSSRQLADVNAYLRATFKGSPESAGPRVAASSGASGVCPQKRKTQKAPAKFQRMKNPLPASSAHLLAGEALFQKKVKPLACAQCHGKKGDGKGLLAGGLNPAPRNFTCADTMKNITDGQMFWVIKKGSPGTGMMAFKNLKDNQIWQLIHYIRKLGQ